jgi:hypothetical protein
MAVQSPKTLEYSMIRTETSANLQRTPMATHIEMRPIERLVGYPRNSRKNDAAVEVEHVHGA